MEQSLLDRVTVLQDLAGLTASHYDRRIRLDNAEDLCMTKRNVELLLERARKLCDPPTWYQLAKRTGIAETTISRCRRRGGTLGDINAWKLAKILGMHAQDVIAYMAEDRAQDAPTREYWRQQLPRLLPSIAIATAGITLAAVGALIDGHEGMTWAQILPVLYIMRSVALLSTGAYLLSTSLKRYTRYAPLASAAADNR